MTKHSVHGLIFESDIDLIPLPRMETHLPSDVSIVNCPVSAEGINKPKFVRALAQVDEGVIWMDVPGIARFEITRGEKIAYAPYPGADPNSIRTFIMGSAMGGILHQRGFLVLHANAIRMGEGIIMFAGQSGAGKSTTAAVLHQRGYEVISDDIVALDSQGRTLGGFPQIKLWQDSLDKLNIAKSGLKKIRQQINKYSFPLTTPSQDSSLPLLALYILIPENEKQQGEIAIETLDGLHKFNTLKRFTYRRRYMEGLGLKGAHFKLCTSIAESTPMANIRRPTSYFNAPELVDLVLEDLKELGIYCSPNL